MGYVYFEKGLFVCTLVSIYGLWLISLSWRGKVVGWLRAFIPFCNVLRAQVLVGVLFQLPLAGYLYLGFSTGMLDR